MSSGTNLSLTLLQMKWLSATLSVSTDTGPEFPEQGTRGSARVEQFKGSCNACPFLTESLGLSFDQSTLSRAEGNVPLVTPCCWGLAISGLLPSQEDGIDILGHSTVYSQIQHLTDTQTEFCTSQGCETAQPI